MFKNKQKKKKETTDVKNPFFSRKRIIMTIIVLCVFIIVGITGVYLQKQGRIIQHESGYIEIVQ